jgi:hypothetical protein
VSSVTTLCLSVMLTPAAEDNPANEYPDDELSSDDEFGYNSYKYRAHGSDDEVFDDEYD